MNWNWHNISLQVIFQIFRLTFQPNILFCSYSFVHQQLYMKNAIKDWYLNINVVWVNKVICMENLRCKTFIDCLFECFIMGINNNGTAYWLLSSVKFLWTIIFLLHFGYVPNTNPLLFSSNSILQLCENGRLRWKWTGTMYKTDITIVRVFHVFREKIRFREILSVSKILEIINKIFSRIILNNTNQCTTNNSKSVFFFMDQRVLFVRIFVFALEKKNIFAEIENWSIKKKKHENLLFKK